MFVIDDQYPNSAAANLVKIQEIAGAGPRYLCLLYTSDAADERSSVDLGGRRIIKKKTTSYEMLA